MLRDIVTYPTPLSAEYSTDVRVVNDEIIAIIDDIKDTINANDLDGLAAFQIGSHFNIVVIKYENGDFLELLNPRVISRSGKITTTETTAYFPSLSADVTRDDNISVIYEDRELKQHSLKADGEFSVLLQRKIDYTFGATFLNKLSKEEKKIFDKKLEFGSDIVGKESCPTTFKRDYILKLANISIIVMGMILLGSLFISDTAALETIWSVQLYLSFLVLASDMVYFFYAHYEAKKYTTCISCQSGNIIGTFLILLIKLTLLMLVSYIFIKP